MRWKMGEAVKLGLSKMCSARCTAVESYIVGELVEHGKLSTSGLRVTLYLFEL